MGAGVGRSIAFTCLRSKRDTTPLRRYQIPSGPSQASSASILDPFVSRIVTIVPLPAVVTLVETGLEFNAGLSEGRGDGESEGEGEGAGEGLGVDD